MLSSNGNPYLRPEYLNPPPMDSKKSPLALLAQTCSQIGSDSPAVPSINAKTVEKKDPKASPVSGSSSVDSVKEVPKKKSDSPGAEQARRSETPDKRKSSSPKTTPRDQSVAAPANPAADPAALAASYKMMAGMAPFPFPYPGGLPGAMPPGAGAYPGLDYAALAKSAMPPPMMNSFYNPAYLAALQYAGAAAAAATAAATAATRKNGDCRDPYCTGCPPSVQMVCVAGCALSTQCDHPKVPIPGHLSTNQPPTSPSGAPVKPYVCNWIVADNYCGKRFATSDDLLQHLRTHTSAAQQSDPMSHPLLNQSFPGSSLRGAYPTPPLSPLSAARYHPYGKSPAPGSSTQSPPQPPAFPMLHPLYQGAAPNPAGMFPHPALASYYSQFFGPRPLGSAPLPP